MDKCIFCGIINKEIKSTVVYEDDQILAFNDINPQAPLHVLIIPKKHIEKVSSISESEDILAGKLITAASKIAEKKGFKDYRLVFNCGKEAGQEVFHVHLHLLAGRAFGWPPG